MEMMKKHPLYIIEDTVKRAFVLNKFTLHDNGEHNEIELTEQKIPTFKIPDDKNFKPILLDNGTYSLRSDLLSAQLSTFEKKLPLRVAAFGRVYDGNVKEFQSHQLCEGIIAEESLTMVDYKELWKNIVAEIFGLRASVELIKDENSSYKIVVTKDKSSFTLGYTGPATWLAKAILSIDSDKIFTWGFRIDIDEVAIFENKYKSRADLYNPDIKFLSKYDSDTPAFGNTFSNKARNILRTMSYTEFSGIKLYESNVYKKMNMIQDEWDANNKGVQLTKPIGKLTGLPTVLTPALEEALSVNFKSGNKAARIFEIGHIFVPNPAGGKPVEKISLSFGAYGPDINSSSFRKNVDSFLEDLGIHNHFFIPTTMAIAYDLRDCWLVLDENPNYLGGNFGGISSVAEANHEIKTHAFMAQLELAPLEKKANEEYGFIPNELK